MGELPEWMTGALSDPRLGGYLRAAGGDPLRATRLYWWNVEVSAALFGPFHCLEVALRNAVHRELAARYARPDWWRVAPLTAESVRKVDQARGQCLRNGSAGTPDDVVAELSFGFWASLLTKRYDRDLWVPAVHKAFPGYRGRRKGLYDEVWSLVLLRNRIMHHEPVHHRDLRADHAKLYRIMGYVNEVLAKEARLMDRFPKVLAARGDALRGRRPPRF
ncbi:hypothetical protein ABZ135_27805 [Streptomyces sp. NPDC006339]|uniref:hypothetical protein n=1 Tax=Streptomyces sp. NPDC006339 TaxID=3156755 RepID=UPI0033A2DCBB